MFQGAPSNKLLIMIKDDEDDGDDYVLPCMIILC